MTYIYLHTGFVSVALLAGVFQFTSEKGTYRHRMLGYLGASTMFLAALASFKIQALTPGSWSWIHLLSILTMGSLIYAILAARRGAIRGHRNAMIGVYLGALIAFVFTLSPGRYIGGLVFGG